MPTDLASRVLVLAPTRRDGEVTEKILSDAGQHCTVCETIRQIVERFEEGAGAILLSDEAFADEDISRLTHVLSLQPRWSDISIIVLAKENQKQYRSLQIQQSMSNVTFLERPVAVRSLVSAIQSAIRARVRQYEIRDQIQVIAQSAEQFELMVDVIPQLAWMTSPAGLPFWFNRRWLEYTGTTTEEIDGTQWTNVLEPEMVDSVLENWQIALRNESTFEMEFAIRGKDGKYRTFLTRAVPLRNALGAIVRWFGTNTDIEESKQLQKSREIMLETERSARLEAERAARIKDEFVATLSHELRTPLSAILGWAYLIRLKADEAETVRDGAKVIERNGRALTQLVEDLLDLSRIITGKLKLNLAVMNLGEVISKALEALKSGAEAKQIRVLADVDMSQREYIGDSVRLQQVVWNLVSNSVKFTPVQGEIKVSLVYSLREATIIVSDNGEGIAPEFLPHLFDRFSQADASAARNHGGLGIGLSLVKQLVEIHGGTVSVKSDGKGKGSQFTIILPLGQKLEASKALNSYSPELGSLPKLTDAKILVVDDEPEVRGFVERLLKEAGAAVSSCGSAKDALALIDRATPALIISDIGMPGEDGYQFIRKVRYLGYTMPAIALTAFVRTEDQDRAILAGFQHHLAKPIDTAHLLRLVEELVG